mgnify:CR=1 FL=1
MNKFKEVPASKLSLAKRSASYGIAINDADYLVEQIVKGKRVTCPYYRKWHSMIERCYSVAYQEKYPAYKGCTVATNWLIFTNFKKWMKGQDWEFKQLDKDILSQGNKIYSESNCIFVPQSINSLFITRGAARGSYKIGVSFDRVQSKFRATCNNGSGKPVTIGRSLDENEAHKMYKKYKYKLISDIALQQLEPLRSAMLNYVIPEY